MTARSAKKSRPLTAAEEEAAGAGDAALPPGGAAVASAQTTSEEEEEEEEEGASGGAGNAADGEGGLTAFTTFRSKERSRKKSRPSSGLDSVPGNHPAAIAPPPDSHWGHHQKLPSLRLFPREWQRVTWAERFHFDSSTAIHIAHL